MLIVHPDLLYAIINVIAVVIVIGYYIDSPNKLQSCALQLCEKASVETVARFVNSVGTKITAELKNCENFT
jgi:hypothetical protein